MSAPTTTSDRLELLQTFIRIVESGSLSAAARLLGTTQPTVSRRLMLLEQTLGLRLLQRSTHAMKLTDAGERCYEHARNLLETWQAIEADLRDDKDAPRGTLRVVVPHAFGQEQLIAPLSEYLREHSEVSVEWLLHDRQPDFIADGIDCAIRVGTVNDPSLVAIRLAEVPRIVVARPGLWGPNDPPTRASELEHLPWLALRTYYRDEVQLTHAPSGEEARFSIRPRMSTDSLYALRNAAIGGLGVGIVSAWVVRDDLRRGDLVHIAPEWSALPLPVYLVYPQARFYPARLRAFADIFRAHMPTLSGVRAPSRASDVRR